MNVTDDRHTRSTVKLPAIRDPFYRMVTCSKVVGGSNVLWHARLTDETTIKSMAMLGVPYAKATTLTGAGNTADNAIKDLQAQIRQINSGRKGA